MPRPRTARSTRASKSLILQKPHGQLVPRVQAVGPEHFGIVAFDCAKARSRYLLVDFYGRPLLEPTTLPHTRGDFQAAIDRVRQAMRQHDLRDLVVAIERTGEYHRPVQQAFRAAGFETRLVHPVLSKLLTFHHEHGTDLPALRQDLEAAVAQLPFKRHAAEAEPLQKELDTLAKQRGPRPLAEIITLVLARLAGRVLTSECSESAEP
jgi:hypothetical protein